MEISRAINKLSPDGLLSKVWGSTITIDLLLQRFNFDIAPNENLYLVGPNREDFFPDISPRIYCISPEGDSLWSYGFSSLNLEDTSRIERYVIELTALSNNDVVGCGQVEFTEFENEFVKVGFLFRISSTGELLWEKYYREINWDLNETRYGYLTDVKEMEDGSLVATGCIHHTNSGGSRQNLWILKVDENGCLDPDDCGENQILTATDREAQQLKPIIFPNPSHGVLEISNLPILKDIRFNLFDFQGRLVFNGSLSGNQKIEISHLTPGIYFCQIIHSGRVLTAEKIVLH